MPTPYTYNVNPAIAPGQKKKSVSTYGAIPGQLDMPSPFKDLQNLYPNLSGANDQISQNIASQLRGELSDSALAAIANDAASFGVSSGMPGSGLAYNKGLLGRALGREQLKQQGLQNYNQTIPIMQGTQSVDPALQAQIAERNANISAAPSPEQAFLRMKELYAAGANAGGGGISRTFNQGTPNFGGSWGTQKDNRGFLRQPTLAASGSDEQWYGTAPAGGGYQNVGGSYYGWNPNYISSSNLQFDESYGGDYSGDIGSPFDINYGGGDWLGTGG